MPTLVCMRIFLFIFTVSLCFNSYSQKTDSLSCLCTYSLTISYPKQAQDNKIGGTVIIEFDQDSTCILSNPKVIKGLGYGCDEEALRLAKQKVNSSIKCHSRCHVNKCSIDKIRWPITFKWNPE